MHYLFILSIIFLSCNNADNSSTIINEDQLGKMDKTPPTLISEECYMQVLKRDTMVALLKLNGDVVSGKLGFDNFEKDGSSGTVKGLVSGDTFKLWYNFQSEGMQSVMEVWFKKKGDMLVRGIGPIEVKVDTSYFIQPALVEFNDNLSYNKINCMEVPEQFK